MQREDEGEVVHQVAGHTEVETVAVAAAAAAAHQGVELQCPRCKSPARNQIAGSVGARRWDWDWVHPEAVRTEEAEVEAFAVGLGPAPAAESLQLGTARMARGHAGKAYVGPAARQARLRRHRALRSKQEGGPSQVVVRLRGYLLALAVCWMAEGGRLLWKTGGEGKAE